jgi:hypothetical protein
MDLQSMALLGFYFLYNHLLLIHLPVMDDLHLEDILLHLLLLNNLPYLFYQHFQPELQ